MTMAPDRNHRPDPDRSDEQAPNPWELLGGHAGWALPVLAAASLFAGGVIAVVARGFVLDDRLVGYVLAGLLLLAPLPMLAGDVTDAILLAAARRRRLSLEGYQRTASVLVPGMLAIVGASVYPVVLAVGGVDLLGICVIAGAFVVFGALPIGGWLVRRLRRPRSEG